MDIIYSWGHFDFVKMSHDRQLIKNKVYSSYIIKI